MTIQDLRDKLQGGESLYFVISYKTLTILTIKGGKCGHVNKPQVIINTVYPFLASSYLPYTIKESKVNIAQAMISVPTFKNMSEDVALFFRYLIFDDSSMLPIIRKTQKQLCNESIPDKLLSRIIDIKTKSALLSIKASEMVSRMKYKNIATSK